MQRSKKIFVLSIIYSIFINSLFAQHDKHAEHSTEHKTHNNHTALFIGATTNLDHDLTLFSLGIDYEYKLSHFHHKLGIGMGGELLTGETTELLAGIPIFYHPTGNLTLLTAPLIIFAKEHDAHSTDIHADNGMKASFAFRFGVNYGIHFNNISISPSLNFDVGGTMSLVYGLGIGLGF